MKAQRPPYRTHGNFNASSRLPDKYHWGAGPDNHCFSCVGTQAWRRDFHLGVNALSVIQKARKIDPRYVPDGPLSEVRDWFSAKKVVRVPNSGGGPLRVNP